MESTVKRAAKNVILLFIRQIAALGITLYSVRVVLFVLGAEDYGIYQAVAGVVTMLQFLTYTMASATQRFFSFALGKRDDDLLNRVFGTNLVVYGCIAAAALILLETLGLWFVHARLHLPAERFSAAMLIYQFAVAAFMTTLFSAPFVAIIIAHEDMNMLAAISILDALFKLGGVLLLPYMAGDKLILYGVLNILVSLFPTVSYGAYCTIRYKECRWRKIHFDGAILREIVSFSWWTLFGGLSTILRMQAVTVLVNQFFTSSVVAARSIALNVSGAMNSFSTSFNTGIYPPIVKAWSADQRDEMYYLVNLGCKVAFSLTWLCALPCLMEMDFILSLWLKNAPADTALFARLAILEALMFSAALPLATAARAPGKMRGYELTLGLLQMTILPLSYAALKMGGEAYITLVIGIAVNIVMFVVRLFIVNRLTQLPLRRFVTQVLCPIGLMVAVSGALGLAVRRCLGSSALYSCLEIVVCIILGVVTAFFLMLRRDERARIISLIRAKLGRIAA